MKSVIVAAGQGTRLRDRSDLKPLLPVGGVPLIERVIARGRDAGIDEFVVVSGYRGAELRAALDAFAARTALRITHVPNEDWRRANGVSLLAARPHLAEPFLLTMCDHLVDPGILRRLIDPPAEPDGVTLAVDLDLANPLIDLDDVTRVLCEDGRIRRIGKLIPDYNAFDTGIFLCAPVVFDALEESQSRGDDSISGAMTVLAGWDRAYVRDIGGLPWIDVDDARDFERAERLIAAGRL